MQAEEDVSWRTCSELKVALGEDVFNWKSSLCKPATVSLRPLTRFSTSVSFSLQLFDANNKPLAHLDPHPHGLRPICRALSVEPGCLKLDATVLADRDMRDGVVASFVTMHACRDARMVCTPWWREEEAEFEGIRVKPLI